MKTSLLALLTHKLKHWLHWQPCVADGVIVNGEYQLWVRCTICGKREYIQCSRKKM